MDHLKSAPIELMGVLSDKEVQDYIKTVTVSFPNIDPAWIIALTQRESGWDPYAQSWAGNGIMQLTGSLFDDMHQMNGGGRGIGEYLDNFKKIQPSLLVTIWVKFPIFTQTIRHIQTLSPLDQREFSKDIDKIQDIVRDSTRQGYVELNMLMGVVYLDAIHDRVSRVVDAPDTKNTRMITQIMKKLTRVDASSINAMLTEKHFLPLTQPELDQSIDAIINDKEKFRFFLTNYNYNGNNTRDADGNEHRIKYAIVTSISTQQLRELNPMVA